MTPEALLEALDREGEAFTSAVEGHLDLPVPACPEWDVCALVGHLGRVYSWVHQVVKLGGERPTEPRPEPPEDRDAVLPWFKDARAALLAELRSHAPDDAAWVFVPPPAAAPQVGWWWRRQALETAVHRVDAEQALGREPAVQAELAVEGIDEFLGQFLPGILLHRPAEDRPDLHGTFHAHATDTEGEWWMDFDAKEPARREHAKADTAVRGPASGLYLWMWNRLSPEDAGLEVFGDRSVVDGWSGLRL